MSPRWILFLVLLVAVVGWIMWPGADDDSRSRADGHRKHQCSAGAALHADEARPDASAPTLEGRSSESANARKSGEFRDADEEGYTLRGTLVLLEEGDREVAVREGKIEIEVVDRDGGSGWEDAHVRHGRWSVTVHDDQRVRPSSVKIGSRTAFFPDHDELQPVAQGLTLRFRARFPRRTVLRVLDAKTRANLNNVRLVRLRDARRRDNAHPGTHSADCVVAHGVASPIEIPSGRVEVWDTGVAFHAYSPGYSWGRVYVDLTAGGERILSLAHGGSVEVRLTGEPAAKNMVLRVRSAAEEADRPIAEFRPGALSALPIEGLPAGAYRLAVEIGEWFMQPELIAETLCEVVAGKRTKAVLEIPKLVVPEAVPLAGEVHVPESWELGQFRLSLCLDGVPLVPAKTIHHLSTRDALKKVPGRSGVWTFDAGCVQPGLYMFLVVGTGYSMALRIGPSGNRSVRVEVPPPVRVSLRVVDTSTGTDSTAEQVWWHFKGPNGVSHSFASWDVVRNPETARFEFRAPLGQISIAARSDDYTEEWLQVQVVPGLPEQTLTIRPLASILIVLKDGGVTVPGWPVWDVKVTPIGGDGRVVSTAEPDRGAMIQLDNPGRYRLELPSIPDYEAVLAQEVLVKTGKVTRLVIQLERLR